MLEQQKAEVTFACKKHRISFHTFIDITKKNPCSEFYVIP